MAGSINKVILIGNVGKDPEIRSMQNGARVANLSMATSESWKDKATGERKEKTEWHRVVVFNDVLINVLQNYVKKGSKLYIEGQLETRKWQDNEGKDHYSTEIVLRPYRGELTLLDSRGGGEASPSSYGGGDNIGYGGGQQAMASSTMAAAAQPAGAFDALDDDIPF
jgi:single-strand DNA-binding protein